MRESVIYQQILEEGRQEGWQEGQFTAKENIALKLLAKDYDLAEIIEITELSLEQIEQLQQQQSNAPDLEMD